MIYISSAALGLILLFGAAANGGADLHLWNFALAAIGLGSAAHFAFFGRERVPRPDWISAGAACAFVLLAVLQVIPLPPALTGLISPTRLEIARAAEPLVGPYSWLPVSSSPPLTLQYVFIVLGYAVVYFWARDMALRRRGNAWRFVAPIVLVCAAEAILSLSQDRGQNRDFFGTYVSYDHFAGLLEMGVPLAAVFPFSVFEDARPERLAPLLGGGSAIAAAIILGAVALSTSRGGFIAALAGTLVAVLLALLSKGFRRARAAIPLPTAIATVAVAALTVGLFFFLQSDQMREKFGLLRHGGFSSDTRSAIWRDTANMIRDYPLLGSGLGTFESVYLRYKTAAPGNTVDYAHNDYLQVMAELGIVGFLVGLFFILRVLQRAVRGVFRASLQQERYLMAGCVGSMVAMLIHSLVDFNMYMPANAMTFAWIAGIAGIQCSRGANRERTPDRPRREELPDEEPRYAVPKRREEAPKPRELDTAGRRTPPRRYRPAR